MDKSLTTLTPLKPAGKASDVFEIDCVSNKDVRQSHIDSALKRNLPRCVWRSIPRKEKLAIVASGPSVTNYVDMLKEWDGEIWGINGAFEWMRHRGIKPHAFIGLDPEDILKDYLISPPKDATYYIAAQVHPCVFDHLKEHNVRLWFMADSEVKLPIGAVAIPGGSSCLGRAPYLACFLGFNDVHLFGGDSSYTHKTHVHGGELPPNIVPVEDAVSKRMFTTTRTLLAQATDIVEIVQNFPGKITVHGDGLMQQACENVKNSGIMEFLEREEAKEIQGMNRKQRRAMKKKAA